MEETFLSELIPATELAVIQALDELCNTRSFERVGVVDIAKRAGISRSSFYYHFSSRNDVVRYLSRFAFAQGIDRIGHGLTWFEGHYTTTRILYPYRSLIIAAAGAQGYDGAANSYRRHRSATLVATMREHGAEVTEGLAFEALALASAEQVMTDKFISGDFATMTIRSFCTYLTDIVPENLRVAVGA